MNPRVYAFVHLLCSTLAAGAAQAVQVNGAPTTATNARPASIDAAARAAMRDDSNSMRSGVIDSLDVANGTVVIQGRALHFDVSSAQVYGANGSALSAFALRPHQRVRFLLDGSDPARQTVRVFYLP